MSYAKISSTAKLFKIPGYKGKVGTIAGYSRSFCGDCNRLRITAEGILKTCLYDGQSVNFKDLLRSGTSDNKIKEQIFAAINNRAKDGFESQNRTQGKNLSMAQIGG